jgi:crotonobetainyl-CoA:carnitine CoA-transferase CaiB-like acyl-CoA transferase
MVLQDERGWQHIGLPVKFRHEPGRPSFDAPAQGEHSQAILRRLGYTERELTVMKEKGVY